MNEQIDKGLFQDATRKVMPEALQDLFSCWKTFTDTRNRSLSLDDIKSAFAEFLDAIVIAEPDGGSFVYRHYGRQFVDRFGVDLNGQQLDALNPDIMQDYRRFMVEFEYSYVLHHGGPIWRSYTASFEPDVETWQRLTLPIMGRWVVMGAVCVDQDALDETVAQDEAAAMLRMVLEAVPVCMTGNQGIDGLAVNVADISGWRIREEELERLATTDALTGLHNRRFFYQIARTELHRAMRYEHDLAILLLDIDHFKTINDTHGHHVGDEALMHIAGLIPGLLRNSDYFVRLGGEEFVVLLPEVNLAGAVTVAEKIRSTLEVTPCSSSVGELRMTVSIGGTIADADTEPDAILERADRGLYKAKDDGRNRVFFVE